MRQHAFSEEFDPESDYEEESEDEQLDWEDEQTAYPSDPTCIEMSSPEGGYLSKEETARLCKLAAQGDLAARETIILSNLRYVKAVASQYVGHGVPFEDLYQEGCYGLIRAIDRYEFQPDATFRTYAWHHITKYIKLALQRQNTQTPIIISPEYTHLMQRYVKTHKKLMRELGRVPTVEEMADHLNISMKKVSRLRASFFSFLSLDDQASSNLPFASSPRLLGELVSSTPGIARPTEEEALSLLGPQFDILRTTLTSEELEILSMKIGLDGYHEPMTFPMIAEHFGVSLSTVRRRWNKLIQKLRQAMT